jgi:hypothetical protein
MEEVIKKKIERVFTSLIALGAIIYVSWTGYFSFLKTSTNPHAEQISGLLLLLVLYQLYFLLRNIVELIHSFNQ